PRPYTLETDGKRIIINWDRPSLNDTFSILVEYESLSTPNDLFRIGVLGFFGGFIVIFVLGFVVGNRIKTFRKINLIKTVLSEDENTVFRAIEKGGEILQDKLPGITGFSKTKVSKIVRNLETKNAVQKIPYKKTNKLKIKK